MGTRLPLYWDTPRRSRWPAFRNRLQETCRKLLWLAQAFSLALLPGDWVERESGNEMEADRTRMPLHEL